MKLTSLTHLLNDVLLFRKLIFQMYLSFFFLSFSIRVICEGYLTKDLQGDQHLDDFKLFSSDRYRLGHDDLVST